MAIEYYSSIDLNKNELQNAVVQNLGSAPGSPVEGQIYYDTGDDTIYFRNASAWVSIGGDITGVTAGDGLTGGGTSGAVTLNVVGGNGITANANDVAITAAQTTITSVLNTSLVVGRDADNQIKFSTDDQMIFRVGGGDGVTFKASGEIEATSLDISGDADIDGTLEADAITVGGTNIISGGIVTTLGTINQSEVNFTTDTATFASANANDPLVIIKNTTNDANGARLQFVKDKGAAGADGDDIGVILFTGDDAAQAQTDFGKILVEVGEADNTDEAGTMTLQVASSDGTTTGLRSGLVLTGHKTSQYVDVTLGSGSSSTVTIPGNLTVSGTTTTVNSTTVNLNDHNIVLDSGNSTSAVVNGAGITIEGGSGDDAKINYSTTGPKFELLLGSSYEDLQVDQLIAASLDISGDVDVDGTLEADAITVNGTTLTETINDTIGQVITAGGGIDVSVDDGADTVTIHVESATTSNVGGVELATSAETQTGTDTARAVTPDGLAARSVVADIDVSSLTDANIVTITHNLGTADVMVQVYDKTTEANIMCDIARTTDDFSTASTSVVSIDFGTAPPNDCRALITSLKGATASGTVAYT